MERAEALRSLRKAAVMAAELARGAYPAFVYGGRVRGVPVFTAHGVEAASFEEQLRFLSDNGYRTVTADEYHGLVTGAQRPRGREVLLTYDDGWSTLFSVGLPLLRRYGMRIVVFVVPTRMNGGSFLSWDEVRAMHESGLADVQSHSLTHARVFCAARIRDFARPALLARLSPFQVPEGQAGDALVAWGRPLYEAAPRLGERRRWIEDPAVRGACETYVAKRGGSAFFERAGWRRELSRVARQPGPRRGRFETEAERCEAIWREVAEAKRCIEQELPGKVVRHLAYPWGAGSTLANRLCADAGYTTVFPAKVNGRYMGVRRGRPVIAGRFGMDFLFRLPGRGRRSLGRTLTVKLGRNVRTARAAPTPQPAATPVSA